MAQSDKYTLNSTDWRAGAKAAVVWFAPVLLMWTTAVLGTVQQDGHVFGWGDLVPSTFTWGSIVGWFLMQVQGMLLRFQNGK